MQEWKDNGQCTENPTFVMHQCPHSCGLCENLCMDQHEDCANWAKEQHCENNHVYMLSHCPLSCGTCIRIRAAMKFGDGKEWPVEDASAAPAQHPLGQHQEL